MHDLPPYPGTATHPGTGTHEPTMPTPVPPVPPAPTWGPPDAGTPNHGPAGDDPGPGPSTSGRRRWPASAGALAGALAAGVALALGAVALWGDGGAAAGSGEPAARTAAETGAGDPSPSAGAAPDAPSVEASEDDLTSEDDLDDAAIVSGYLDSLIHSDLDGSLLWADELTPAAEFADVVHRMLPTEDSEWTATSDNATFCLDLAFDLTGNSPHCYRMTDFVVHDGMVVEFDLDGIPLADRFGPFGAFTGSGAASLQHDRTFFWPDDVVTVLWSVPTYVGRPTATTDDGTVRFSHMARGDGTVGQVSVATPRTEGVAFTLVEDGEPIGHFVVPAD